MRTSLLTLTAALALTLAACGSNSSKADSDVPCICGTDEALIDGCAHPLCLADERNPNNPDCVCGQMTFEEK
jgi:hypothetical protein